MAPGVASTQLDSLPRAMLVQQAALGDWVLTFPLLRRLVVEYGGAWAVSAASKAALAGRCLDGVVGVSVEQPAFSRLFVANSAQDQPPHAPWPERFASLRCVVSFASHGVDAWAANLRRLAPQAHLICLSTRPPESWPGHITAWHEQQISAAGLSLPPEPALPCVVKPGAPITLHPGSGGHAKCWPADRFEALAQRLRDRGLTVQGVLGEAELERWPPERLRLWQRDHDAVVPQTPCELAEVLSHASAYIGNDSGPTHLAAALGLPTLALFGPTNPRRWAPIGPAVHVVAPPEPQAIDRLDLDRVEQAVAGLIRTK